MNCNCFACQQEDPTALKARIRQRLRDAFEDNDEEAFEQALGEESLDAVV